MKKKYMFIILAAALSLTACGKDLSDQTAAGKDADTENGSGMQVGEAEEFHGPVLFEDLSSSLVSLGQYKGLEAKLEVEEVTDEDVEKEIRSIQKTCVELKEADRPAEDGDVVVIDYTGYVDGETSDSLQGKEYSLELGSGSFVPGFEDQLVGAAAGEDREVNLTFPEDYYEEMAGKDARFEVHVYKVQEYDLENWNDEFIRENLEYESEEDMRESVRKELEADAEEEAKSNLQYELVMTVLDGSEFQIEDADVDAYMEEMLDEYRSYAQMYNVDLDTFLEDQMGVTRQQLKDLLRENAAARVQMALVLHEAAEREGLTVSDAECQQQLEALAEEYGYEDVSAVEGVYSREAIRERLLMNKAIEMIRENAVVS